MGKYPVVDLRSQLAGGPVSPQGHVARKTSVTAHYNGPAVTQSAVAQLKFDAEYHTNKNWGTPSAPAYTKGIQYEAAIGQDGTRYILRNPKPILWHCANQTGNAYSRAFTFLIGEGQRITKAAAESAAELCDDWCKEDGIPKSNVFGHQEWSSTACPGSAQSDFVIPYRSGKLNPAPPEKSEKWPLAKYNFVGPKTAWARERAAAAVAMINEAAGKTLAAWTDEPLRVVYASQEAYESETVGKLVCIAVGEKSVPLLSSQAESVFGKYAKKESDIWDGRYTGELWECIRAVASREKLTGLAAKWNDKYGGSQKGDGPKGGSEPEKPEASGKAQVIDRFFAANYSGFGPYSPVGQTLIEEAERAGLALNAACALVEQESGGRNIFGCDHGSVGDKPPYCRQPVTEARVVKLRASGMMNGVGTTQLTWHTFVTEAEKMGGAHIPRYQMRVGFDLLAGYFDRYGEQQGYSAYNAGEANRMSVMNTYGASCVSKSRAWRTRLG